MDRPYELRDEHGRPVEGTIADLLLEPHKSCVYHVSNDMDPIAASFYIEPSKLITITYPIEVYNFEEDTRSEVDWKKKKIFVHRDWACNEVDKLHHSAKVYVTTATPEQIVEEFEVGKGFKKVDVRP